MNVPEVNIKQLLEAGVHLGHKTQDGIQKWSNTFWWKKFNSYYRLNTNSSFFKSALSEVHKCISTGGKILIVSTKKQASEQVSALAQETGQYFVNYRWLGGMLTNWNTIQNSIKRMKLLDEQLSKDDIGFTKKRF